MKILFYPILFSFLTNASATEFETILDTFSNPVKYCEKYILASSNINDSNNINGSLIPKQSLFSSTFYLKQSKYLSTILEGIFRIEPLNDNLCGNEVKVNQNFNIVFNYKEFKSNNYLNLDSNRNYYLSDKKINVDSIDNYAFTFIPILNLKNIIKPSYMLSKKLNDGSLQTLKCDYFSWCFSSMDMIQPFILRILPVVTPAYGKAFVMFENGSLKMQNDFEQD